MASIQRAVETFKFRVEKRRKVVAELLSDIQQLVCFLKCQLVMQLALSMLGG
jgi:hypothetical protein